MSTEENAMHQATEGGKGMSKKDAVCMFSWFGIPEDEIKEAVRTWMKVDVIKRCFEYKGEGWTDVLCGKGEEDTRGKITITTANGDTYHLNDVTELPMLYSILTEIGRQPQEKWNETKSKNKSNHKETAEDVLTAYQFVHSFMRLSDATDSNEDAMEILNTAERAIKAKKEEIAFKKAIKGND